MLPSLAAILRAGKLLSQRESGAFRDSSIEFPSATSIIAPMIINIVTLPGDGIGPEVTTEAVRALEAVASRFRHELQVTEKPVGGAAILASDDPLPAETVQACLGSTAVLLGAVGGPAFDHYAGNLRPEAGLLRLRKALGVFANLRPAICLPGLEELSPLRPDVVRATDVLIVRELLGGLYFGERHTTGDEGSRRAVDTLAYSEPEIERIARVAFELADKRRKKLSSVDKANVLDSSRLWREVVNRVAGDFPSVSLNHMYVDSAAMALVSRPSTFDVIVTENMFGDILSDQAGAVVGSLGLLPSASIGGKVGLYEPIHGSAPDIAGKGLANPLGSILSAAMLLRHSFQLMAEAASIESAVRDVLASGHRTPDLANGGDALSTRKMGELVAAQISQQDSAK
jgi:3-isopropylmalate dehydrogenase